VAQLARELSRLAAQLAKEQMATNETAQREEQAPTKKRPKKE
jgi:hypothetical protein